MSGRTFYVIIGGVFVSIAAAIGAVTLPSGDGANLYVDLNGGTCTRSASLVSYNDAAACPDIVTAYAACQPGDTVWIKGGRYGVQEILHNNAFNTAEQPCLIEPAAGEGADIQALRLTGYNLENKPAGDPDTGPEWITFRRINTELFTVRYGHEIRLEDSDIELYFVRSSSNVVFSGDDIGPWNDFTATVEANSGSSTRPSENVVFDGNVFHDVIKIDPEAHTDCMSTGDVDGLYIRNNIFRRCAHFSIILATDANGNSARNVVIENNVQTPTLESGLGLAIGETDGPVMVRFNSMGGPIADQRGPGYEIAYDQLTFDSNVIQNGQYTCFEGATWTHNVMSVRACGETDTQAPAGFAGFGAFNYQLVDGAAGLGHGNPANLPTGGTDLLGVERDESTPDAGAYEKVG